MINKDTELYFSVSSKPGNLGATVYNELFNYHKINAIYKPIKAETDADFVSILRSLRAIGASGLSVSMPFKYLARQMIDPGDNTAFKADNANTINLKTNKCYNTDMYGIEVASGLGDNTISSIVAGDGAMAHSIQACGPFDGKYTHSLLLGKQNLYLLNEPVFFHGLRNKKYLFNATPMGMDGIPDDVFTIENTKHYSKIIDCVPKNDTNLKRCAEKNGIKFVSGIDIFAWQVREQFFLYTGLDPDIEQISDILDKNGFYK